MTNHSNGDDCLHKEDLKDLFNGIRELEKIANGNVKDIKHLQDNHIDLIDKIGRLEKKIEDLVRTLANRLPLWATMMFSILTAILTGVVVHSLTKR